MTAVYVVRHPQTTWNATERYQGRLEAPISADGRQQIRLTVAAFAGQPLDAVYTSPLSRALELAEAIAGTAGVHLTVDNRLTEIAMGPWEGLFRSQIAEKYPEMYREWYKRPDLIHFPHGESLAEVQGRAQSVLADIHERHPGKNVFVATHSAVVQTMVAPAIGLDLRYVHRMQIANTGITTLCGGRPPGRLLSLNVTEHLHASPVASALAQKCAGVEAQRLAS
jgi:broad specificity phosphatase PhoE